MAKKASTKKKLLVEIKTKLEAAFPNLKKILGDKKFNRRAKKAAKILNAGVKIKPEPKPKKEKEVKAELSQKPPGNNA